MSDDDEAGTSNQVTAEVARNRASVTAKGGQYPNLHGYLKKKSRRDRWQRRWFEANDHYLTYYKSPQSDKLLACIDLYQTGSIKLAIEDDASSADESFVEFSLELGDRFYIIKAETREDAKRWVAGLNERKKPKVVEKKKPVKSPQSEGRFTSFVASPNGTSSDSNVKDEEEVAAKRDANKVGEPAFVSAMSKPQATPSPGCGACVVS